MHEGSAMPIEIGGYNIPVLFHRTNRYAASKIINSGKLFLPLAETNRSEREANKKVGKYKLYYLSFARNLSSGYIFDRGAGNFRLYNDVVLVFSKEKLQQQRGVILKPLDYWGPTSDFSAQIGRQHGRGREQEERLYSDKREVPIKDALVEVIISIQTKDLLEPITATGNVLENRLRDRRMELSRIRKLVILLKKRKIPFVFIPHDANSYNGVQDENLRKRVMTAINDPSQSTSPDGEYPERRDNLSYDVRRLTELVYKKAYEQLSKDTRSSVYYMRDINGMIDYFSNTMHNMRSGSQKDALMFDKLLKEMKAKSVEDFFTKLWNKWSKILDER